MKNKLLIFLLFLIALISSFGQTVPNTATFSLQNVVKVTGGTSLQEAFDNSIDSLFDSMYEGDHTSLLNFKNYGNYMVLGWLYNWYVGVNAANIANTGWHMPTVDNWLTLTTYLGWTEVAGGRLKETGTVHWLAPNTAATNSSGFTGMPGGYRHPDGTYYDRTKWGRWWTSHDYNTTAAWGNGIDYNSGNFEDENNFLKKHGFSIVLIKDATTLTNGQTGTYTGNNGHVYSTICIGGQEWMSENLIETIYRNGTAIPLVSDNTDWAALTTGGRCIYTF